LNERRHKPYPGPVKLAENEPKMTPKKGVSGTAR